MKFHIHSLIRNPSLNIINCIASYYITQINWEKSAAAVSFSFVIIKLNKERESIATLAQNIFGSNVACAVRDNVVSHSHMNVRVFLVLLVELAHGVEFLPHIKNQFTCDTLCIVLLLLMNAIDVIAMGVKWATIHLSRMYPSSKQAEKSSLCRSMNRSMCAHYKDMFNEFPWRKFICLHTKIIASFDVAVHMSLSSSPSHWMFQHFGLLFLPIKWKFYLTTIFVTHFKIIFVSLTLFSAFLSGR